MTSNIPFTPIDQENIQNLVRDALSEDCADQDLTTNATVPIDQIGHGVLVAKSTGVICGLSFGTEAFHAVDPKINWLPILKDGDKVSNGTRIAEVRGLIHPILRAERVVLNFLHRLAGIATMTRKAVDEVTDSGVTILDTRKTTPGLRLAERYAVRVGGGTNHRNNLKSAILIKDNHIAAIRARGQNLTEGIKSVLCSVDPSIPVQVEVTTIDELEAVLESGARAILLDNFALTDLRQAVERIHTVGATAEASGGITLNNVGTIAKSGVDFISMGALTHSPQPIDISFRLIPDRSS